ncbi:MEDS domain-containing protein [Ramlibacter sp. AN1015]|uniref:MEDS domain-containing protein n=1 Tax=Ramlibacter sp. AN1015 TaxID=3133428 RepID=UPI0030BE631E
MQQSDSREWSRLAQTRIPPPDTTRPLQAHDHAALVYWSREEFLQTIVPFLADGLRAGDLVVHVAHDEPIEPVVAGLEALGFDTQAEIARGKLALLTASQAFAPLGHFDLEGAAAGLKDMIRSAQAAGAPRVRFSVDLSYILSSTPGIEDFMVFDARANEDIFPTFPFICICAYDAARGVNTLVEDMFLTHPLVYVRGIPMANPYYQPWQQLRGQGALLHRWKSRYSAAAARARA